MNVSRRDFARLGAAAAAAGLSGTTPYFETASEKYAWLNAIVCVGVGYTVPTKVPYRIFQIL